MDLNEILSFKPEKPSLKRAADGELTGGGRDSDMRPPRVKNPRGSGGGVHNSHGGGMESVSDEEKMRILQSLEEEDEEEGEGEGLDAGAVKRMLLSFEKKVKTVCLSACTCAPCVCVCGYCCALLCCRYCVTRR